MIIATVGLTNNSSFNIFENTNSDYILGGINAQSINECNEYEIRYDYFNEDDEIIDSMEELSDDDFKAYILVNDMIIFLDEMMRI